MITRAWLFVAIAACGDNQTFGLDATFEGGDARYFGTAAQIGPPPELMRIPVAQAEVCIDETCDVTTDKGTFVLAGAPAPHESLFTVRPSGLVPVAIAVIAGAAGDRNLGTIPMQPPDFVVTLAAAFGEDPQLETRGGVLVLVDRYNDGAIELAIDGATARYLDGQNQPVPAATSVIKAAAVFFALPPGEVILRTAVGECEPIRDGWPGATRTEIRVPILVGHFTLVRPYCLGG